MISIGVLTPHAAPGPEVELPEMARGHVVTRVSRISEPGGDASAPPPTTPSALRALTTDSALDHAAAALVPGSVDAIGYASTSTGYTLGLDAEVAMLERLSERRSRPVAGASSSSCAALRALGVGRLALVHPPWFDRELNDLGAAYYRREGFEVVTAESADLANDPRLIETGPIVEWICGRLRDEAEAVVIGGTGFRAAGAIQAVEGRTGRPVLEANQVLLWSVLTTLDAAVEVTGYGRLFEQT